MGRRRKPKTKKGAGARRAGGEPREPEEARATGTNGVKEWAKSIAIAVVLFLLIRTFLVQTFVITSGSMKNSLMVGDMLVASRLAVGPRIPGTQMRLPGYSEPRRGDVVVFLPHHEVDMLLIKRLVGLPGDTLEMRSGLLWRNGERVDEPYVNPNVLEDERSPDFAWQRAHLTDDVDPATYDPTRKTWGPLVVPDEHYFMLGDNRDESLDSRYWGPLQSWRLEARASFIYFSYDGESYKPFPALLAIEWNRIFDRIRGGSAG